MAEERRKRVVLVTGFGPFAGHPTNASWEAVKELRNRDVEGRLNVALVTAEIPVAYESVSTLVPELWSKHDPMLVVHVGVSSVARCLTLESRAHTTGYDRPDVESKICPLENEIGPSHGDAAVLETGLDVQWICDGINSCDSSEEGQPCNAEVSTNAGRYLCEYIFRQSLLIQPSKTMFVHVPDLPVYPARKTAEGLYRVIRFAVQLIDNSRH